MLYLTPEDFFLNQNQDLCNKIGGYSFVMFNSPDCVYCKDIHPSFVKVSKMILGCTFAVMEVGQRIIGLSQQSKTPIEYVPYILLYGHGQPIAQYQPDEINSNIEKMTEFLVEQTKQTVINDNLIISGVPKTKNRVCYLGFDKAYKNA